MCYIACYEHAFILLAHTMSTDFAQRFKLQVDMHETSTARLQLALSVLGLGFHSFTEEVTL